MGTNVDAATQTTHFADPRLQAILAGLASSSPRSGGYCCRGRERRESASLGLRRGKDIGHIDRETIEQPRGSSLAFTEYPVRLVRLFH
jgi:hypothetical protein